VGARQRRRGVSAAVKSGKGRHHFLQAWGVLELVVESCACVCGVMFECGKLERSQRRTKRNCRCRVRLFAEAEEV